MNCNNWNKCADVIHRLSSRVKNEQNQSAIVDNCGTMVPLCIEKSFYQCKNNVGQECCVEVCGNCSDPIKLSSGFIKNTNANNWEKSICDNKINRQFLNPISSYRHQFTSSNFFDTKGKYIDYVVTNVLRQVVNHIPLDSLHQLSCCLPPNIEEIFCNTNIDADCLVRILVTEVLQCYGTNAGQLTDWYAFANSIKPLLSPSKSKDDDNEKENDIGNKVLSKPKKLPKYKKISERLLNNHIESPVVNKEKSSESIAFSKVVSPSTDINLLSVNRIPSPGVTSQIMSTTNSISPMSTHSKATFTPIDTKYQSRTKPSQNFVFDKTNKIDHHESLAFHEKSTNRTSSHSSQTQYRILSDSHHYNYKSNKNTDRSSSSDCILTIHHKYKHKRTYDHHQQQHNHHITTSFDTPSSHSLSSHTSVPINELAQKYKQTSIDACSIITDKIPVRTKSRQNISLNSANTEQLKSSHLLTNEQKLLFKLPIFSDNAAKHFHQIESPSFQLSLHDATISSINNEHQIPRLMDEVEVHEYSIADNHQLSSSQNLTKSNLLSSNNHLRLNTNSVPLKKKPLRINHYPNMLADFD